jgi:hypothetical protein
MFSVEELVQSLAAQSRSLGNEILELSDLTKVPLNPGESVADRHHKLAKLGKGLAESFVQLDAVLRRAVADADAGVTDPEAPPTPNQSQTN